MVIFIFLLYFCCGIGLHGTLGDENNSFVEINYLKVNCRNIVQFNGQLIQDFSCTQSNFFDFLFGNKPSIRTCSKCKCGIPNRRPRMVGGTDLKPYEFPWLAQIIIKDEAPIEATLINSRYVITSAISVYG